MSRIRHLVFQVEGWKRIDDLVYVGGRNCGADIRIGDKFSTVRDRASGSSSPATLRVEKILLYGKYMNQLSTGMTAELGLTGSDATLLSGRSDLHGDSTLAPFESVEVLGTGVFHLEPM